LKEATDAANRRIERQKNFAQYKEVAEDLTKSKQEYRRRNVSQEHRKKHDFTGDENNLSRNTGNSSYSPKTDE